MHRRWLATTAILLPAAAHAGTPGWTISEASGPVTIVHAGVSRVAMRSGAVGPGDIVRTGPKGRAVIVRAQEYVLVAPASQVRLPAVEQKGAIAQMVQDAGDVVFMIRKMATPHFAVETPYLAAVVKGTTFSVSVGEHGAAVKVLEGAVDVATADGGAHELLKPGGTIAVDASRMMALRVTMGGIEHIVRGKGDTGPVAPASPAAPFRVISSDASPAIVSSVASPAVSLAQLTGGLVNDDAVIAPAVITTQSTLPASAAANVGIAGSSTPQATLAVAHAGNTDAVVAVNAAVARELASERAAALAADAAAQAAAAQQALVQQKIAADAQAAADAAAQQAAVAAAAQQAAAAAAAQQATAQAQADAAARQAAAQTAAAQAAQAMQAADDAAKAAAAQAAAAQAPTATAQPIASAATAQQAASAATEIARLAAATLAAIQQAAAQAQADLLARQTAAAAQAAQAASQQQAAQANAAKQADAAKATASQAAQVAAAKAALAQAAAANAAAAAASAAAKGPDDPIHAKPLPGLAATIVQAGPGVIPPGKGK